MNNFDDEPGSGEKRERSEGRENRGGQAGQGKHQQGEAASSEGGGQLPADKKNGDKKAAPKPQKGPRPASAGEG